MAKKPKEPEEITGDKAIINNEPNPVYHSRHEWISSSRLKLMGRSPYHFSVYHQMDNEPTEAMQLGTALHMAVLEPDKFDDEYFILKEKPDRRTKAGKEEWDSLQVKHAGKTLIMPDSGEAILSMRKSIVHNNLMQKLLTNGIVEQSMYWTDPLTGIKQRCRPDFRRNAVVIDIKTTRDASPEKFALAMSHLDYHLSAAHYCEGISECHGFSVKAFLFVAVESSFPYTCAVYRLSETDLENARARRNSYLQLITKCQQSGIWPGYESHPDADEEGIITIKLPHWVK